MTQAETQANRIDDGGVAFPLPVAYDQELRQLRDITDYYRDGSGMSLRDYFAAKAMAGMLSYDDGSMCASKDPEGIERERREYADGIANAAFRIADAMLRERAKGGAS